MKSKGEEESREVVEATQLRRDTTYQEYLVTSKKLLEAGNAENGLIGRVHKGNKATKACADRLFQLVGESVGSMVALEIAAAQRVCCFRSPSDLPQIHCAIYSVKGFMNLNP